METINVFSVGELSPKAFEKSYKNFVDHLETISWQNEIFESLKELFKRTSGIKLEDYSIGMYCHSSVRVSFDHEKVASLSGARAFSWLENNLLAFLRIPFEGSERWKVAKYGKYYRPGMVPPCPLTGYCFDDTLIDCLVKSLKRGATLKDAFEGLADCVRKELEGEYEFETQESSFREFANANQFRFLADGTSI